MTDTIAQILDTAWRAWRWRGLALLATWFVCLVGWVTVSLMPDMYKSSAVVYVDTANVLQPLLKGLMIEPDTATELELVQKTLISRPNLEKVMRETDLDLTVQDPTEKEQLISDLGARISVTRQQPRAGAVVRRPTDLFKIEFEDANPVLARDVVRAVLNIFVESNLGQNRQDLDSARRFIEEQISSYEKKLTEAERRIAQFRRDNADFLSLSGRDTYADRVRSAREELATAEAEARKAEVSRDALRQQLSGVPQYLPPVEGMGYGPPTDTQVQILEQQAKLDELRSHYTDKHPDVIDAQRKLEALLEQQRKELDAAAAHLDSQADSGANPPASGLSNPVYEQLKVQLAQEEATTAALVDGVAKAKAKVQRLEGQSENVSRAEAQLAKLNRDYDVLRGSYDALLSSRETEQMSRARESQGADVRFRILEPPHVPTVPSGPNHLLFLIAVLIAGIGSGTGIAVLLAISSDTFANAGQIKNQLAISVLGTVSISEFAPRGYWAVSQSVVFWFGLLLLVTSFAGLSVVELTTGLAHAISSGGLLQEIPADWLRRLPVL